MAHLVVELENGTHSEQLLGAYTKKEQAEKHRHILRADDSSIVDSIELREIDDTAKYIITRKDTSSKNQYIEEIASTINEAEDTVETRDQNTREDFTFWYTELQFDADMPDTTIEYKIQVDADNVGGEIPPNMETEKQEWTTDFTEIVTAIQTLQDNLTWIGRGSITIQGKSLLDSTVTIEAPAYVSDIPTHPTDLNWNHASK